VTPEVLEGEEPAPQELPAGSVEECIKTLNLAERLGLETALKAVSDLSSQLEQAQGLLGQVMLSLQLDPELDYPMDAQGHVFTGRPRRVGGPL